MYKNTECRKKKQSEIYEVASFSVACILKALCLKLHRRTLARCFNGKEKMFWTVSAVSPGEAPAANVRNHLERQTIRSILRTIDKKYPLTAACEVGCGYGRLIMVLQEFFKKVVGFEREPHLVNIAGTLLPKIEFCRVESLDKLNAAEKGQFDFVMTCTVLQHLTDDFCKKVLEEVKRLAPKGHILLIEKTVSNMVTDNTTDGEAFISRARSVDTYAQWMKPYSMISVSERNVESTYEQTFNQARAGSCMLFRSPLLNKE